VSRSDASHASSSHFESRLEFETLISDTSAALFAAVPEQVDAAVEHALDRVRVFFQADRCALLSVSADQQAVRIQLETSGEGVPRVPPDMNLAQVFPWSRHTLFVERVPVRISRMADLPPEAAAERDGWRQLAIRSALVCPVESGGTVGHLIVLNAVHQERDWPEAFLTRLRVFGELIVAALDRQAMFAALGAAEERVSLAADSAEAGLWTLDPRTGVLWVTNRTRAIFGFGTDEVVDMARVEAAVIPDDWEIVRGGIERAFRECRPVDVEYRIHGPGDVRWVAARGQPHLGASGEPESLMGYCIDITRRKRAQEAVRVSEARLAAGIELAGLGFYEVDFEAGAAYFDERLQRLLGLPRDRTTGLQPLQFWLDGLHPDDRAMVLNQRIQLHDGRLERIDIEYRFLNPVEGERWVQHSARVSGRDATGRTIRSYGVLRDVTEGRRAEEALRQSFAEIERLKDRLQAESEYLKAEIGVTNAQGEVTGQSAAIQNVLRQVRQVAPTNSSVLVLGETGTGKEVIAQYIHRLSPRQRHVMVKVNCAALPAGLVESELFGREKGAFTGALTRQIGRFEVADGSTLFLDEVGELSLELQAKLLRVLEVGEFERLGSPRTVKVNVRVIAATNRDLEEAIRQGRFREDLYYRLNVFPIRLPPLRDRAEDIPGLVWEFLEQFNARMGKRITQVPRKTMESLQRRPWRGNIRELRNVIEHGAIVSTGTTLRIAMIDESEAVAAAPRTLAAAERELILQALDRAGWRIKGPRGAAAELGLNPATLYGRMKKLGIPLRGATEDHG
jgi:PAS domain S-box-containing protein